VYVPHESTRLGRPSEGETVAFVFATGGGGVGRLWELEPEEGAAEEPSGFAMI